MNADDLLKAALYAGETKALMTWMTWFAVIGWATAVVCFVFFLTVRFEARKNESKWRRSQDENLKLLQKVGRLNTELNEAMTLRDDAEYLKAQYRELDDAHELLKANFEILTANYNEQNARAIKYRTERNKSDERLVAVTKKLDDSKKIMHKLIDRIALLTQHVELELVETLPAKDK